MKIALRMDDVGASSKQFEIYGTERISLFSFSVPVGLVSNFLAIKYLPGVRQWGPYRELNGAEVRRIVELLVKYKSKLTVAVTACWVDCTGNMKSYPEKYPEQAKELKKGLHNGILEIANHGLTHCVVGKHLPRFFTSNRKFHREFWPWIPDDVHYCHIEKSQRILQEYFECKISTLVPPGNVFSDTTEFAAKSYGIERINCNMKQVLNTENQIRLVSNEDVFGFHDREIIRFGMSWFEEVLKKFSAYEHYFVKEF